MRKLKEGHGFCTVEVHVAFKRLFPMRIALSAVLIPALVAIALQQGCLWRRNKPAAPRVLSAPMRILILPPNVRDSESDLRELSLLSTVMLARIVGNTPDLETIGFRDGLPSALQLLGGSRHIEADTAAMIGERLAARWVVHGSLSRRDDEIDLLLDFIPTKTGVFAFRYEKKTRPRSMDENLKDAVSQFLFYRALRPLASDSPVPASLERLQRVALALDREYGWFAPAAPGEAPEAIAELHRSDAKLAQVLFDTMLQAGGAEAASELPGPASAPEVAFSAEATPSGGAETRTLKQSNEKEQSGQPSAVGSAPTAASPVRVVLPPPLAFTQKIIPSPVRPGASAVAVRPPEMPRVVSQPSPLAGSKTQPKASKPEKRYLVQIYATQDRVEADARADRLREAGFAPMIRRANLGDKGLWYRVRIAGFESRETAAATGRKLIAEGIAEDYWVIP